MTDTEDRTNTHTIAPPVDVGDPPPSVVVVLVILAAMLLAVFAAAFVWRIPPPKD